MHVLFLPGLWFFQVIVLLSSLRHPSKNVLSPRMVVIIVGKSDSSAGPRSSLNSAPIPHFIVSYLANLNELRKNVLAGATRSTVSSSPR